MPFEVPPVGRIDSVIFWFFSVTSLLMMATSTSRLVFKQSDIDVLFPTPVSPKIVLGIRFARDYFSGLLLPLFLALIGFGSMASAGALRQGSPLSIGIAFRAGMIGWTLLSLAWLSVRTSTTLYVGSRGVEGERLLKTIERITWGLALAPILAVALTIASVFQGGDFVAYSHWSIFRILLAPATLATYVAMAPLSGDVPSALISATILVAVSAIGIKWTFGLVGQLYEQAATNENVAMTSQARRNPQVLTLARARAGKVKVGKSGWLERFHFPGATAFVWKDLVIRRRSSRYAYYLLGFIFIFAALAPEFMLRDSPRMERVGVGLFAFILGMAVFTLSMASSQEGSAELLTKIDTIKPLAIPVMGILSAEVVSRALPAIVISVLDGVIAAAFVPGLGSALGIGLLAIPSLALLIVSIGLLVSMVFPEIEDTSQASFRGLIQLLGISAGVLPGIGLFAAASYFHAPWPGAILWAIANLGICLGVLALATRLYSTLNPNE